MPLLDLYYWTTPNGHKITILLEELGLPYNLHPIDINKGDQFTPEFLAISPNNRIPALVDPTPNDSDESLSIFESGAILEYLADKTGAFLPQSGAARYDVLQWLYWQMGGLGPMAGQNHHFSQYAPEKIPYAISRYVNETARLYHVLDKQLADKAFITGEYSIADMASYPWIRSYKKQSQDLNDFPNIKSWFERISARPAVIQAYAKAATINNSSAVTEAGKSILFGQKS
ncbi:MAG: thiol:disulfide oxidoreductase [Gammaproteobacteria bacterium]|nr:MAG: thiol:disulfide oxidoreductase [Gammaproteobacteria bacterium]PHR84739.1 MAG: thiol:disulfide oxidoreductase [Colwellia sp.]